MPKKLFFLFFVCLSTNIFALDAPISMNCTIKGVYEVDANGRLQKVSRSKDSMLESFIEMIGIRKTKGLYIDAEGSEFVVNRRTGSYTSKYLKNEDWKKYILDFGSKEQSFKLLSISTGGYMHTQYLQIQTFVEGYLKPFYLIDGTDMFTGICN
jgi:hypothetical protein